jgi:hypothetical protein
VQVKYDLRHTPAQAESGTQKTQTASTTHRKEFTQPYRASTLEALSTIPAIVVVKS